MTSTTPISTITIEPDGISSNELIEKEKFTKRFKPSNLKRNKQSDNRKQASKQRSIVRPLQADDIKEHLLWALVSSILCFFLIAPCIALYYSRRIRTMKKNGELTQAKTWSDRANNLLLVSNGIGLIIWIAILTVIGILCVMGTFF